MIACPFDPAVDAVDCCDVRATDCCNGDKPVCATATCLDANGDVDVVVCVTGHGCNTYAQPEPDPTPDTVRDAWTREDEGCPNVAKSSTWTCNVCGLSGIAATRRIAVAELTLHIGQCHNNVPWMGDPA